MSQLEALFSWNKYDFVFLLLFGGTVSMAFLQGSLLWVNKNHNHRIKQGVEECLVANAQLSIFKDPLQLFSNFSIIRCVAGRHPLADFKWLPVQHFASVLLSVFEKEEKSGHPARIQQPGKARRTLCTSSWHLSPNLVPPLERILLKLRWNSSEK